MKIFQSAYLAGRYATAEPEGHASQCDFFMRVKVRLQSISAVSWVFHTLLKRQALALGLVPADWPRGVGSGSPALRKSRGRPHLLQQADARRH